MTDVLIITGSESDKPRVAPAIELLEEKGLSHQLEVISAHRNLKQLVEFLETHADEFLVIIAAAGLSAALPGVVTSLVSRPVIGIPLEAGSLGGMDALLSILQLPKGVPVATMGIGKQGVLNAVHLAERIVNLTRL